MASSRTCGTTILFGGNKQEGFRFCGDSCLEQGTLLVQAVAIPDELVVEVATEVHRGMCPACGGSGPVDVHTSHRIWSLVLFSSWSSTSSISCRPCGVRRQLGGLAFSILAGWWGFPWDLGDPGTKAVHWISTRSCGGGWAGSSGVSGTKTMDHTNLTCKILFRQLLFCVCRNDARPTFMSSGSMWIPARTSLIASWRNGAASGPISMSPRLG